MINIKTTRELTEKYLGRALISQTLTLSLDSWQFPIILLPRPPLIAITEVRTLDESDVPTVYASSNYYSDTIGEPGSIIIKSNSIVPQNTQRLIGGYEIEFTCGFGSILTDVPQGIREGIKLWATSMYENRVVTKEPPPEAINILSGYRIPRM